MHEQSETVMRDGRAVNVYGRGTPRAGQPLPPIHDFERADYDTIEEAVAAARKRSELHGQTHRGTPPTALDPSGND